MYLTEATRGAGEKPQQMARMTCRLTGRVQAIRLINIEAMQDQAYKHVYGKDVPRRFRRPLIWLVGMQAKYGEHATAGDLNSRVQDANDCSLPSARNHIRRAVDFGMISREEDGKEVFYFFTDDQISKLEELIKYLIIIPEVVKLQERNPKDLKAGSDLLPPEVYYNIVDVADFDKVKTSKRPNEGLEA